MRKTLISLVLLTIAQSKKIKYYNLGSYTFDQYLQDFNKSYPDEQTYLQHKALFEQRLQEVIAHNMDQTQTYKLTVSGHTDQVYVTHKNFGYNSDMASELRFREQSIRFLANEKQPLRPELLKDLPAEWDWRQQGKVTPIKDQKSCGSCWAFTSVEVIESHVAINSGKLLELSPQQLVDCVSNPFQCGGTGGCSGLIPEVAFSYGQLYGIITEEKMPYQSVAQNCTFDGSNTKADVIMDGYEKLPANDYSSIMSTLYNKGPLAVSVQANAGWMDYDEGVFNGCPFDQDISMNHAVTLVGYGTDSKFGDYWIVRNHWGTGWGEDGYIRLARSSTPQCGYDVTPKDGSACKGDGQTRQYVCDTCAIQFDVAYPIRARLV